MTTVKKQKSEKLTRQELKDLKAFRKTFKTDSACAAVIGVDRTVLINTAFRGSGSPDSIAKFREALYQEKELIQAESLER